jgi:hypothetical protein
MPDAGCLTIECLCSSHRACDYLFLNPAKQQGLLSTVGRKKPGDTRNIKVGLASFMDFDSSSTCPS